MTWIIDNYRFPTFHWKRSDYFIRTHKLNRKKRKHLPFYCLFRGSEFHRLYRRYPHFETSQTRNLQKKEEIKLVCFDQSRSDVSICYFLKRFSSGWFRWPLNPFTLHPHSSQSTLKNVIFIPNSDLHHRFPNLFFTRRPVSKFYWFWSTPCC